MVVGPGLGAIKKTDWKPFAQSRLQNRKLVLHQDRARTYKLRVQGLLHDWVVHKKKKIVCVMMLSSEWL